MLLLSFWPARPNFRDSVTNTCVSGSVDSPPPLPSCLGGSQGDLENKLGSVGVPWPLPFPATLGMVGVTALPVAPVGGVSHGDDGWTHACCWCRERPCEAGGAKTEEDNVGAARTEGSQGPCSPDLPRDPCPCPSHFWGCGVGAVWVGGVLGGGVSRHLL